ncbi:MAG TPA: LAGLIDADG family homing endonuclease, partial [Polyangiaceae bacterium]|nr:LAGLIDADG family homing endonuclease [Polyangiaceae bacterium]
MRGDGDMAQSSIVDKGIGMEGADDKAAEETVESRKLKRRGGRPRGLHYERKVTTAGTDPLEQARYEKRTSVITNTDGSVVFKMEGVEVPAGWSQLATDIIVSKYFRKAGLFGDKAQGETSARQVVYRIAHTIREAGDRFGGYFASTEDADSFEAELSYFLLHQYGAFNSPVWFNCGLWHEYNIKGAGGNFAWNPVAPSDSSEEIYAIDNNYERPQCSACFIQAVNDDLMSIYDLVKSEAKLFKYGSGCTSGNSRIYVEGRGLLPIRDLYTTLANEGREAREFDGKGRYLDVSDLKIYTLSIDSRTGEYQRDHVEKVWQYDVAADDKITVRFDTGARATVSKWHPFLVWNGEEVIEKRADELGRGDAVLATNESALAAMRRAPATVHYTSTYFGKSEDHAVTIDTELAWLCGYFLGDGTFGEIKSSTTNPQGRRYTYDRLRLRFTASSQAGSSEAALKRVQNIVARAFGEHGEIQDDGRGKGKQVCFTGRYVTGFFAALFEPGPKTHHIPSFLWQAERSVALAFLAGLIDADGEVREGRAQYLTSSRDFANDVGVLASLHGLGGGFMEHRNVSAVTLVRELADDEARIDLAAYLAHPDRKRRLLDYDPPQEREFCMPLAKRLVEHLLGSEQAPSEWLRLQIGDELFHFGRLRYEGLVHPQKLARVIRALGRDDFAWLARIAQSLAFVQEVEACTDNPDFYDLTVAQHENYLAGEAGLVAIHNTGTNFSAIRSKHEKLSGGGTSSGLMSFLEVLDRAAGATKSGGTTRRAAKMVCLDMDHPEIVDFIQWKVREERKAKALIAAGYDGDFNGDAYHTVSGQNSNNSVRVTDKFMRAATLSHGGATPPAPSGGKVPSDEWHTTGRTTGEIISTHSASQLWRMIAEAAWECADPGVQYDSTINNWHTCPNTERIRASNPCSEFMYLDDTACNLSSLNLTKFLRDDNTFDVELYRHAVRVFFTAMEILVDLSSYPTRAIAKNSHDHRPLGLGYANLGTLLMRLGLSYDSDEGRALAAAVTSILCGQAYRTSAEMASSKGAFAGYAKNEQPMLRVMG